MSPQDRYTAEEIAQILGIRVETLYDHRWRDQSKCPLYKQGKRLFSDKHSFERWYQGRLQYV